jgi:hypothetical protein
MSKDKATLAQIQEAYGAHSAAILNQLHDRYDEIAKSKPDTAAGTFFERLSDEQKMATIRDHRLKLANEAREQAKQKYSESVRTYREQVEARKAEAEAQLYGHGQELSADVLARAALASDEELRGMARIASKTNNASLKQAALSVAADRGMGDALIEVFGDEDRELYSEIQQGPPREVLDRQTHDVGIDAVVPGVNVDELSPPAKGST